MEDIYKRLKQLEDHHVRAVRGLEKLANALEHVRAARTELSDLARTQILTLPSPIFLSNVTAHPPRLLLQGILYHLEQQTSS